MYRDVYKEDNNILMWAIESHFCLRLLRTSMVADNGQKAVVTPSGIKLFSVILVHFTVCDTSANIASSR